MMSKTVELKFKLTAKDLPMGGGWTCAFKLSESNTNIELESNPFKREAEAIAQFVSSSDYKLAMEALTKLDLREYENNDHVGYLQVYSNGSWEINQDNKRPIEEKLS